MRCQNPIVALALARFGNDIQGIRVHDQGLVAFEGEPYQLLRPGAATQARADGHDVRAFQGGYQLGGAVQGQTYQLRPAGNYGDQILRRRGHGDQPRTGTQAGLPA